MKQIKQFLILILSFSSILFAQERMIIQSNGEQIKLNHKKDLRKAIKETKIKGRNSVIAKNHFVNVNNRTAGLFDTLSYRPFGGSFNTDFGFFDQDVMLMWFEAPADMIIKAIGFTCSDDDEYINDSTTVGLRLIKLNWSKEQLKNFNSATYQGYYPSDENALNNADYFGENASGSWVSTDENNPLPPWTNHENPDSNSFDYDLLSDNGSFFSVVPRKSESDNPVYNWLEINTTRFGELTILRGDLFAVVAKHNGVELDSSRIGIWSDYLNGYPGWIFHANGSLSSDEPGWWVRMNTWDFAVIAEFTNTPPPRIHIAEPILTTISIEPQTVCAEITYNIDIHGAGDSVKIELVYILDGIDTNKVEMSSSDNYNYCADIPGQNPGTNIIYWVQLTNRLGYIYPSGIYSYYIFQPYAENLIVVNGYLSFSEKYYFGVDSVFYDFSYDLWKYGPLSEELVDNYRNIFEIHYNGPKHINDNVIRTWLENGDFLGYFLCGDEYLGFKNGFIDSNYTEGDFEYDILGLTHSYNDVSYDGTSGSQLYSNFYPIQNTLLGDPLFHMLESNPNDTLIYDPIFIIDIDNWHDGFDVKKNTEVFMKAKTRGISGQPEVREVNVGVSNFFPNNNLGNNYISFLSFNPIALTSTPFKTWYGFSSKSPQMQTLFWFFNRITPSVKEDLVDLKKFSLSQNYPNPFNPSTTIKYSIPVADAKFASITKLLVYDILGRKVGTLVNQELKPGNYEVKFNASGLSSGVYYYRLISGSYQLSKKMLLIK